VTANWSPRHKHWSRIHHHIVLPNDALPIAEKIWKRFGGLGTVHPEPMTNEGDYTKVAQYMIDNVQGRPSGENKWSSCRGMLKPVITEPVEVSDVEDVQPLDGGIIKDVMHYQDEDGRTVSAYLRQTLPEKVKIRGGQIVGRGGSNISRTAEQAALRYGLTGELLREYEAITNALEETSTLPNGKERLKLIKLIYFSRNRKTIAGAAQIVYTSERTARRWNDDMIHATWEWMKPGGKLDRKSRKK